MNKKSILWAFLLAATGLTTRAQQAPAREMDAHSVVNVTMTDTTGMKPEDVLPAKDELARDAYRTVMDDVYRRYQTITPANFDTVFNEYRKKENELARLQAERGEIDRPYYESPVFSKIDSLKPAINYKEENRYYRLQDMKTKRPAVDYERISTLNAEVVQAAQKDFPALYERSRNSMSRDLDLLRAEFKNDSVRIADPQELVYAIALGMKISDTSFVFNGGGQRWYSDHTTIAMLNGIEVTRIVSTDAQVIRRSDIAPWRIIVPETLYSEYHHPNGFTNEEDVIYANLHEKHHVEDGHFLKAYDNTITYYAEKAARMKAESYADVAAIGDMIIAGHRVSLIDDIMIWRSLNSDMDMGHFTMPSMQGLKDTLIEMGNGDIQNGVEALKRMPREDVLALYQDIVKTHGMTTSDVDTYEGYTSQSEENKQRVRERVNDTDEDDIKRVIAICDQIQAYKFDHSLTIADSNLAEDYDGIKEIKNRAFKNSGVILPSTVCKAYADLQDELRVKAAEKNDQTIYARMRRLESDFIMYTSYTDYFGENKARGVDLFKYLGKEPLTEAPVNGIIAKSSVRSHHRNGQ